MKKIYIILCIMIIGSILIGETIYVDGSSSIPDPDGTIDNPYHTIQDGIDNAQSEDEILILEDTYYENLIIYDKHHLILKSLFDENNPENTDHIEATIIDGNLLDRCLLIEDCNYISIIGLSFTNGLISDDSGGGIKILNSSCSTLKYNHINDNEAKSGGGLFITASLYTTIINNEVTNNLAQSESSNYGGGIYSSESNGLTIDLNLITENETNCSTVNNSHSRGGGIAIYHCSDSSISNNNILNNSALNQGGGIFCWPKIPISTFHIFSNEIANNTANFGGGFYSNHTGANFYDNVIHNNHAVIIDEENPLSCEGGAGILAGSWNFTSNILFDNDSQFFSGGLTITDSYESENYGTFKNNMISHNYALQGGAISIQTSNIGIINNTILNNSAEYNYGGIWLDEDANVEFINTILWGNKTIINDNLIQIALTTSGDDISAATINYCCIQGGEESVVGDVVNYYGGNIELEPLLVEDYPAETDDYKYHLLEGSPCIDSGDPAIDDPDGTTSDIGCYSSIIDVKPLLANHWNWVSFPRIVRDEYGSIESLELLQNMLPFPNYLELEYEDAVVSQYQAGSGWIYPNYEIYSTLGYKLYTEANDPMILPEQGIRLAYDFESPLIEGENWVGYWIPKTQKFADALGDQLEYITSIKGENGYIFFRSGRWYGMVGVVGTAATFEYGKGYVITSNQSFNLQWEDGPFSTSEAYRKEPVEYFTYEDKPNYEAIDIDEIENGEGILEIAVFAGDECIGASKVTDYPIHLQAYTQDVNRDSELTFEVVTGRGSNRVSGEIQEYDFRSGKYITKVIHPTSSGFRKIRIVLRDEESEDTPAKVTSLFDNFPNPFNPETEIKFNLAKSGTAELTVFNMKGQKIKTLVNGIQNEGIHSVIWNGKDNENNSVASGIYFYKLTIGKKTIQKKMILLK